VKPYDYLKKEIIDIVADQVPVNHMCPHCEQEIDFECIVDRNSRSQVEEWDGMATRIVEVAIEMLPKILKEVLNK